MCYLFCYYFLVLCLLAATIVNGTTQKVPINTNPQGATAKNQDGVSCLTPCSLELKQKKDHIVTISKEGFETQTITCQHVLSGAVAGNILLGGLIGAGVDAASGSMYRITPEAISCELKPILAKIEEPGLPIEKLKELHSLKEAGAITDSEYEKLKAAQLEKLNGKSDKGAQSPDAHSSAKLQLGDQGGLQVLFIIRSGNDHQFPKENIKRRRIGIVNFQT